MLRTSSRDLIGRFLHYTRRLMRILLSQRAVASLRVAAAPYVLTLLIYLLRWVTDHILIYRNLSSFLLYTGYQQRWTTLTFWSYSEKPVVDLIQYLCTLAIITYTRACCDWLCLLDGWFVHLFISYACCDFSESPVCIKFVPNFTVNFLQFRVKPPYWNSSTCNSLTEVSDVFNKFGDMSSNFGIIYDFQQHSRWQLSGGLH